MDADKELRVVGVHHDAWSYRVGPSSANKEDSRSRSRSRSRGRNRSSSKGNMVVSLSADPSKDKSRINLLIYVNVGLILAVVAGFLALVVINVVQKSEVEKISKELAATLNETQKIHSLTIKITIEVTDLATKIDSHFNSIENVHINLTSKVENFEVNNKNTLINLETNMRAIIVEHDTLNRFLHQNISSRLDQVETSNSQNLSNLEINMKTIIVELETSNSFLHQNISSRYLSSLNQISDNLLLLVGGVGYEDEDDKSSDLLSDVWLYNIQTNEWQRQDDIPSESFGDGSVGVYYHRGVTIKNKDGKESVFVFGGKTGYDNPPYQLKDVLEFSLPCQSED